MYLYRELAEQWDLGHAQINREHDRLILESA